MIKHNECPRNADNNSTNKFVWIDLYISFAVSWPNVKFDIDFNRLRNGLFRKSSSLLIHSNQG